MDGQRDTDQGRVFFDVDQDQQADEFVVASMNGRRRLPLVVVEDDVVSGPTTHELKRVLDAHKITAGRV